MSINTESDALNDQLRVLQQIADTPAPITEELIVEPGMEYQTIAIPVSNLPAGSLITITIRVGPEPAPVPGEVTPTPPRYMGQSRMNRA